MTTTTTDWTVWLGPAAGELSDEQRRRFEVAAAEAIARIGEDPDLQDDRDAALSAIVQYLLGDTTIDQAGAERQRTRAAARAASLAAQQVVLLAIADGMTEAEAARRGSVDRMHVRKLLGK